MYLARVRNDRQSLGGLGDLSEISRGGGGGGGGKKGEGHNFLSPRKGKVMKK